jgi:hypothetical protein
MPNQEATTLAKTFINKIAMRWGVPKKIITDQGTNFTGHVMKLAFYQLGITRYPTTAYHPQSDGLVERFNRTLKTTICKLASDFEDDWDEQLDAALGCYRFAVNSSLQDSPYFVMTGQDARTPLTAFAEQEAEIPEATSDAIAWKREFFERMQAVTADAKRSIEKSQEAMKLRYDRTANPPGILPGDMVAVRKDSRKAARKLKPTYDGPYRVVRRGEHSDNVIVVELGYGREKHVNISRLKPYFQRGVIQQQQVCLVQEQETTETPSGLARVAC